MSRREHSTEPGPALAHGQRRQPGKLTSPDPRPVTGLERVAALQQSAGNHAVAGVLARDPGVLARDPGPARHRRRPDPPLSLFADDDGYLFADTPAGRKRVGNVVGDTGYVAVGAGGEAGVAFADAELGYVEPGGSILAARAIKIVPDGDLQPPTEPGGVAVRPVKGTLSGPRLGVLFDYATGTFGAPLLQQTGSWKPIGFDKLPAEVQSKLREVPQAHLKLDDGSFWSLMTFHLRDETADKTRWARAKEEWKNRKTEVETDAGALPDTLKAQVDQYLSIIASVMAHEGTYTSKSPGSDPMASVGIFQWGMEKNTPSGAGTSLGMFFLNLKKRAEAAQAAPPPVSKEDQLYIDAWAQVTSRNVDVQANGKVTIGGSLATGAQAEAVMAGGSGEMGKGALKQYQLVAAMDWIEAFKGTVVRPGLVGAAKIGQKYREPGADPVGTKAALTRKKGRDTYTFALDAPDIYTTLGDLFSNQKNVGLAVILGVNRPHYVETALWRALDPGGDPKAQAEAILDRIITAAETAAAAVAATATVGAGAGAAGARRPRPRARTEAVTPAKAKTWNAEADYEALRRLIWPEPRELDAEAEEKLAAEFESQALQLYKPGDARKFKREQRFATVEAAFE